MSARNISDWLYVTPETVVKVSESMNDSITKTSKILFLQNCLRMQEEEIFRLKSQLDDSEKESKKLRVEIKGLRESLSSIAFAAQLATDISNLNVEDK